MLKELCEIYVPTPPTEHLFRSALSEFDLISFVCWGEKFKN